MMKNLFLVVLITTSFGAFGQEMTNDKLEEIITQVADTVAGGDGQWQFAIKERLFLVVTDATHNRMRIISPVDDISNLTEGEILNALVANFHTALDVKYAISDEMLWSVFIHPLRELTDEQVEDAIIQVYNAAATFGTTYSSTNLSFPGNTKKKERAIPKPKSIEFQKG